MHILIRGVVISFCTAALLASHPATAAEPVDDRNLPRFILWKEADLEAAKARLAAGDEEAKDAFNNIVHNAEKALQTPVITIIDKPLLPPSGDKRDYMSLSPYWWPNPDTPDGLPYVRRDGEFNPDRDKYDLPKLDTVTKAVRDLGPAYYFTGDEKYAEHAAKLLRAFLLDPMTGMNPNLKYAQFRPGHSMEVASGIIESNRFRQVTDAVIMLERSQAWTDEDRAAIKDWFRRYVEWMRTSEAGREEAQAPNNHGTWYALQVVNFALFVGDEKTAREVLDTIPNRIASQIEPDGSQPHELERTNSLHYSDFNLRALLDVAYMGRHLGYDLYGFETPDGRSIRKGLDFLIPYATGKEKWPHKQISGVKYNNLAALYHCAAIGYDDERYAKVIEELPGKPRLDAQTRLMQPWRPAGTTAQAH